MPPRSLLRAFLLLWIVTGVALLMGSLDTVRQALGGRGNPHHLALLGSVEALAALLFLIPRTTRAGSIGLVAVIGLAFVVHAMLGQFRGDLLVYAAATAFVGVHRPLTEQQLRFALRRTAA